MVTRAQDSYDIGEVVAYRNEELGVVVLHRIVALEGDTYVLEGDNNGFRDHYQPIGDDLVGVKWIYWPDGGRYVMFLRNPMVLRCDSGRRRCDELQRPSSESQEEAAPWELGGQGVGDGPAAWPSACC